MTDGAETPLWQPDPARVRNARITAFARAQGLGGGYAELHAWSLREPEAFWRAVWEDAGLVGDPGGTVLLDGDAMPGARWFPEARLNFAENLLRRRDAAAAIVYCREDGHRRTLSFVDLAAQVRRARRALEADGVGVGDRVCSLLPNVPEAVTAMLAAASLGAVWSSASPDFGTPGVLDRFAQVDPAVLLVPDAYRYKGRDHDQRGRLAELQRGLPGLRRTVVVPCAGEGLSCDAAEPWETWLGDDDGVDRFERLPFDTPLYVLFSSGTTGRPKCIVHGAGGTLLQHRKEHRLHTDLGGDDRLFYFTTTGWMMWNWLVSALAGGTTIVLFDGNPFFPDPHALWRLATDEAVTAFGTSAKFVDACRNEGLRPGQEHDLSALRILLSTGSPLVPEAFDWIHERVGADVQIASISGGTDIVSCFVLGCPVLPVYRGEIQCRGLGMAVDVFDDSGRPVVGRAGELVCTRPFPSMPLGFQGDDDGSRYRAAYFERFPGVWCHGDWAVRTEHDGFVITGRSDATLNPGGVRIGTAEIYRQVEGLDEVVEALVVGQDWHGDQRVVLFVVLRDGVVLDEALIGTIRRRVREGASPRHVPAVIVAVPDVPRTRSGKISEMAVRDVIHGRPVKNTGALANPEALEHFRDLDALR